MNQRMNKVWIGAGVALTATLIAVGCNSSKGSTFVTGSSSELGGSNALPASAISTNNLAADGGGFSNNNQTANVGTIKAVFNNPRVESLSPHTSADNSAMIFFVTTDDVSGWDHAYVSHFAGSTFTPPVEITGANRDETVGGQAGGPGATASGTVLNQSIHASSVVMIPFNTSNFVDTNGNANNLVRSNQGNWAIMWDAETLNTNPNNTITGSGATIAGAHHTVYLNMFLKSFAGQPAASTQQIGNTATSNVLNGTSATELHFGFQVTGVEITNAVGGAVVGETVTSPSAGFFNASKQVIRPAEDIVSYGAATDTFVHCAYFQTSGNDNVSGLGAGAAVGPFTNSSFEYGVSNTTIGGGSNVTFPGTSEYLVGDNTSFIQLFWVQMIASGDTTGASNTFFPGAGSLATIQLGDTYQFWTANLNLTTMTISGATPNNNPLVAAGQQQVPYTPTMNAGDARAVSAAQAEANFVTYNNLVFWNFVDTSLADSTSTPTTPGGDLANIQQSSQVLSVVAVIPQAGGSAELTAAANQTDITVLGNSNRHSVKLNGTANGSGNSEQVHFGICSSNIGNFYHTGTGCPIIGTDEGQGDVVAFVVGQVSTNLPAATTATASASTKGNTDQELWAVALVAVGADAGTLDGANNPRIVSVHNAELSATSANAAQNAGTFGSDVTTPLVDPVTDVKLELSRDGTYALLGWRQALGTSENSTLGLNAAAYQVAVVTSLSTTTAPTLTTIDQRLSSVVQVNATSAAAAGITYTNQPTPTGSFGIAAGSPVVAWDFQDHVQYATGFQGVADQLVALYLYNDGTQDRLWVNTLVVTLGAASTATTSAPPTLKTENELELDATPSVPGIAVYNNNGTVVTSTFTFLPGSHGYAAATYTTTNGWTGGCTSLIPGDPNNQGRMGNFDAVDTVDAGSIDNPSTGDVLIVFSKVVDATTVNNTFFDRQILATLYSPPTATPLTDVVLSQNVLENANGNPVPGFGGSFPLAPNYANFRRQLVSNYALVPNAKNPSVTAGKGYSPSNGTYVYFTDLDVPNSAANAGLFTRHFFARTALGTGAAVPTLAQDFAPTAGTSTSATSFVNPTQIDTLVDENVSSVVVLTAGTEAMVTFVQDNHWWATITQNGGTYTNAGGLSTPILIDNNFSAANNGTNASMGVTTTEAFAEDRNGDDLHGTILAAVKNDVDLNQRIYVRVLQYGVSGWWFIDDGRASGPALLVSIAERRLFGAAGFLSKFKFSREMESTNVQELGQRRSRRRLGRDRGRHRLREQEEQVRDVGLRLRARRTERPAGELDRPEQPGAGWRWVQQQQPDGERPEDRGGLQRQARGQPLLAYFGRRLRHGLLRDDRRHYPGRPRLRVLVQQRDFHASGRDHGQYP
jgi:hypothetical protein